MSALTSLLVRDQQVSVRKIEEAIQRQVIAGGTLDTTLLELRLVGENVLAAYCATAVGLSAVDREALMSVTPEVIKLVPRDVAVGHRFVPLGIDEGGQLSVAVSAPLSAEVLGQLAFLQGGAVIQRVVCDARLESALAAFYGEEPTPRMKRLIRRLDQRDAGQIPVVAPLAPNVIPERSSTPGRYSREATEGSFSRGVDEVSAERAEEEIGTDRLSHATPLVDDVADEEVEHPSGWTPESSLRASERPPPERTRPGIVAPPPDAQPPNAQPPNAKPPNAKPASAEGKRLDSIPAPAVARPSNPRSDLLVRRRGPLTLQKAGELLRKAGDRDEILEIAFAYARQFFDTTAFFLLHEGKVECLDAVGTDVPTYANLKQIALDREATPSMRTVNQRRAPVRFSFGVEAGDERLKVGLARTGGQVGLLVPVLIRQRVILVIYGDRGPEEINLSDVPEVLAFAPQIGNALQELILRRKTKQFDESASSKGAAVPAQGPTPAGWRESPAPASKPLSGATDLRTKSMKDVVESVIEEELDADESANSPGEEAAAADVSRAPVIGSNVRRPARRISVDDVPAAAQPPSTPPRSAAPEPAPSHKGWSSAPRPAAPESDLPGRATLVDPVVPPSARLPSGAGTFSGMPAVRPEDDEGDDPTEDEAPVERMATDDIGGLPSELPPPGEHDLPSSFPPPVADAPPPSTPDAPTRRRSRAFDAIGVPRTAPPPPRPGSQPEVQTPSEPPPPAEPPRPEAISSPDWDLLREESDTGAPADAPLPDSVPESPTRPVTSPSIVLPDERSFVGELSSSRRPPAKTERPAPGSGAYVMRPDDREVIRPRSEMPPRPTSSSPPLPDDIIETTRELVGRHPSDPRREGSPADLPVADVVRVPDTIESATTTPPPPPPEDEGPPTEKRPRVPSDDTPKVILELDRDIAELVDQLRGVPPDETVMIERIVRHGEIALPALVRAFPGNLWFDRNRPHRRLPRGRDVSSVARAIVAFGKVATPYLMALLDHRDPDARFYALLCSAELKADARLVAPMGERIFDEDSHVAGLALDALREFHGHEGELDDLFQGLRAIARVPRQDPKRRLRAIRALGALRDVGAVELLMELLDAPAPKLGATAHDALVGLTARDLGTSTRKWRSWFEEHGSAHRIEWLIDGLCDADEGRRKRAYEELKNTTQQYLGFSPTAPKKEREVAQRKYRAWWEREGRASFAG